MKKIFLLTSLILITFGFSLNSNVIHNFSKENNVNNAEQINSKTNETNNNIPSGGVNEIEIIEDSLEIESNYAKVGYEIKDCEAQIGNLIWFQTGENGHADTVIGLENKKWSDDEHKNEDTGTYDYKGTIQTDELSSFTEYQDTYLFTHDANSNSYESSRFSFITLEDDGTRPVVITQTNDVKISKNEDDGTIKGEVDYSIIPGVNENKNPIIPLWIQWYDYGDDNDDIHQEGVLDDIILETDEEVEEITGTFIAENLLPNANYNNTVIKAGDAIGTEYNDVEIKDFNTNQEDQDLSEPGSIIINEDPKVTGTEATVNYEITKALDENGKQIELQKITWYYNKNLDKEQEEPIKLASKEENFANISKNPNERIIKGSITATDLNANDYYQLTYLLVEDSTKSSYKTNYFSINTESIVSEGEIQVNDAVLIEDKKYNAKVTYTMTAYPTDSEGDPKTIESITWMGKNDKPLVGGSGIDYAPPQEGDSTNEGEIIVSGLTPGTKYEGTYLLVDDNSLTGYKSNIIEPFTTDSGEDNPEVSGNVTKKNGDKATIEYKITPAKNHQEKDVSPTNIIWFAEDKETVLAQETPDSDYGGKMTAEKLEINKNYGETYLIIEYKGYDELGNETDEILQSNPSECPIKIPFTAGNYKTRKIIMGSSILGIFVVIFAIIGFFFWAYKKRRRVN